MSYSRASTATLGGEQRFFATRQSISRENGASHTPTQVPMDLLPDREPDTPFRRLIIAVDFGTTYSAISYVALESGESVEDVNLDRVRSIQNFPDDWNMGVAGDHMKSEVPTEVMYPMDRHFRDKEDVEPDKDLDEDGEGDVNDGVQADIGMEGVSFDGDNDDDIFGRNVHEDSVNEMAINTANSFRWGYAVHEARRLPAAHTDLMNEALSRFKLLLDNSPLTDCVRQELRGPLEQLRRRHIIKNDLDVIVDFLTCLLRHARTELEAAGFDDSYQMEIVLCVPTIWTQKACRDMQTAMAKAMQRARFVGVDVQNNSIENLFIVSEPEAAAAYVLKNENDEHVSPGDTFVLLDAGGGTVDANTYTVNSTIPLRLEREVATPGGGLYGSSYVNEKFRAWLTDKLKTETYLEDGTNTIKGHVERAIINEFEYRTKRSFDIFRMNKVYSFHVSNLRDDPAKGFRGSCVQVFPDKMTSFFESCLKGIAGIMEDQINAARARGTRVQKVLLIGGFAASVSLQKYLRRKLSQYCQRHGCHISLVVPGNTATAVASGAVLRAINKEGGPRRIAKSSYGLLRTEPFKEFPEHAGLKPSYDPDDGLPYVVNTIDWVLKLGQEVDPVWACPPIPCSHTFACSARSLLCREVLYVSDTSTASHYQLKHINNRGAEKVGEIVVDFTFLREHGLIHPINGSVNDRGKRVGRRHYRVNYLLTIEVVDRDLRCYAVYDGRIMERCRINIASAFIQG